MSLYGSVTNVAGTLPAAIHAASQGKGIICPKKNGAEACWAGEIEILAANNLLELINHFVKNVVTDHKCIAAEA